MKHRKATREERRRNIIRAARASSAPDELARRMLRQALQAREVIAAQCPGDDVAVVTYGKRWTGVE